MSLSSKYPHWNLPQYDNQFQSRWEQKASTGSSYPPESKRYYAKYKGNYYNGGQQLNYAENDSIQVQQEYSHPDHFKPRDNYVSYTILIQDKSKTTAHFIKRSAYGRQKYYQKTDSDQIDKETANEEALDKGFQGVKLIIKDQTNVKTLMMGRA